jgi:hypothetical protein
LEKIKEGLGKKSIEGRSRETGDVSTKQNDAIRIHPSKTKKVTLTKVEEKDKKSRIQKKSLNQVPQDSYAEFLQ